ncbi:MAG: hypothetical protein ACU843_07445 [Gammaproteobacteria bacterium]
MNFLREVSGVRLVETRWDDTLQKIALRELGSAENWVEIANINGLSHPYIVNKPEDAAPGVAVAGDLLKVPSATNFVTIDTDPEALFGRDVLLNNGKVEVNDNDIDVAAGVVNLRQAIKTRIKVSKRELLFHPEYGCWVSTLIGKGAGPSTNQLAGFYVRSALLEDDRISEVVSTTSTVAGDTVSIESEVRPIQGKTIDTVTVV